MVLRNCHKILRGHHLVPEHVETRSLYSPEKPGVEQVSLWFLVLFSSGRLVFGLTGLREVTKNYENYGHVNSAVGS